MKTINGNNNIVLVEALDGSILPEFELDDKTTIITGAEVANTFNTKSELVTYLASKEATKFPPLPTVGEWCEKGMVYAYGTNKAKCLQGHNRMSFAPEETPALFLMITTVSTYPVWKQPAGAHDAYQIGDRVYFPTANDLLYESKINANVWSPTAYPSGWKKL